MTDLENRVSLEGEHPASFEAGKQYDWKEVLKDLKFAHRFMGTEVYEARDEYRNGHYFYFNRQGTLIMVKDKDHVIAS